MNRIPDVDRYGFPLGMSIEFRRALRRFERSALTYGGVDVRCRPSVRRSRRVNVVIPFPLHYGGMRVQADVARTLAEAGYEVHVFLMRAADEPGPDPVPPVPFARVVRVADQETLCRYLAGAPAAGTVVGGWIDYLPAAQAGTAPVIGYCGGEPTLNEDSKLDARMLTFRAAAHRLPDHLLTCSRFIQLVYHCRFGRRSTYVPVSLDAGAFAVRRPRPAPRRRGASFRVLLMAWDGLADKGLGEAIPALRNVCRAGVDLRIVWVTPKPPVVFVGLDCELHVDPPRHEVFRILGSCDVLLYPPRVDGLGLPPLEAMAAGVPVVVTGGSGSAEFARDGVNALVVPPGDAGAIEHAVRRMECDLELRAALRARGRRTAARYHPRNAAPALLAAFGRVTGAGAGPGIRAATRAHTEDGWTR
ncbi:glycosyltransferase family 4 protein [Phytoactinopolyspora halotolerans]|uniref:Glycosyltransferase family 4 protein n=1 Tax=Phytoactinopolyspora halotolerans TaxID=1981512 RepID=A0A6L9S5S4_9ACTN|nr:glycosyltransferase family 4 protein [Phytoactinopolyspora halotolerans]NED99847.1 glycosyltransferase family 4 protein [Phytoactinopolyspora halotolerans]